MRKEERMDKEEILRKHLNSIDKKGIKPHDAYKSAMEEYASLRISELEAKVKDAAVKLNECFIPKNIECDGGFCVGCWKDVVREVINSLNK